MPTWDLILGPYGLLVVLIVMAVALWRDHLRADADDRAQRDIAMQVSAAQVEATKRLADVIEERDRLAATRQRQGDA